MNLRWMCGATYREFPGPPRHFSSGSNGLFKVGETSYVFFGKRESLTKTEGADQHGWWRWLVEVLLMLETNLDDLRYMK